MLILFDNNVPRLLRRLLKGHVVRTAWQMQWDRLQNGHLLEAAQRASFDLMITADQNLEYQQNLNTRAISLIVLGSAQSPYVLPHLQRIVDAVDAAKPGSYAFIEIPLPPKPRRAAS